MILTYEQEIILNEFLKRMENMEDIGIFEMKLSIGDAHILVRSDNCTIGGSTPNLEIRKMIHYEDSDMNKKD